ncbi:HD-GYP domain, c-di-GMP phosphodiesterase class II (or its inactivated variant) [Eubacterium maltosivorans]|uniref:HD-GYP domain-containing protein n=1 Tax=Eubacterium maltosivorans TaxID=2041044 RepID=UPI0008887CAE|nr:HD domain-containing phosphohydrolase [Eubacterium maltosivorans]WPK82361.1 3'3'-cGAMP-specific phosphodiesterase 1 [Eubacterium maltosivorans]SDO50913.1 HD-GYP domain, c-di-GMP phosphodiesterase class II (or its inactivated variant) [Eubacterium maltosivorans]
MEEVRKADIIRGGDAVQIVRKTLGLVDERLVNHGERVGYMLYQMLRESERYSEEEAFDIFNLGVFHDIGAYKTDEIDKMVKFEADNVWEHSIYGYLFLKYLSPLKEQAEAILFHHLNYDRYDKVDSDFKDIALMIKLTDRVDISMQGRGGAFDLKEIKSGTGSRFNPEHVDLFLKADAKYHIIEGLNSGAYEKEIEGIQKKLVLSPEDIDLYLQMLAYSIDFRSEYTVTHTVTTVGISVEIARLLNYSHGDRERIYYGALLHDVGKIAIPLEILEYPGKLSPQAMKIMKTHVQISEDILRGAVADDICEIAIRHHEKLDGSGYHRGLSAAELTEGQQIVAIADVLSALRQRRSYKEAFPREKIIEVLKEQSEKGKLCPVICNLVIDHYDAVMENADSSCEAFLSVYDNLLLEYERIYNLVSKL